jgi:hypothetical protein
MDNVLLPNDFTTNQQSRVPGSHQGSTFRTLDNGDDPTTVEGLMGGGMLQFRNEFLDRVVTRVFRGLPDALGRGDCWGDDPARSDDVWRFGITRHFGFVPVHHRFGTMEDGRRVPQRQSVVVIGSSAQ